MKQKFAELLGKRSASFITSILQITAQNSLLAQAEPASIYQAAAIAATMDLPINQNLGFAYIIPYKTNTKQNGQWVTKVVAQFQMGYKGFIQLAQRSGQFKSVYAAPIYEGQIVSENPLDGYEFDFTVKSDKVVGYAARFKLINGFEATLYMSKEQLIEHGMRFSQSYKSEDKKTRDKSLWNTDFENMAKKTVLKLLLSRFAPLSVEMQTAVISDQAVINDATVHDVEYIDNTEPVVNKEEERLGLMIDDAQTMDDLMNLKVMVDNYPELLEKYETKFEQLNQD